MENAVQALKMAAAALVFIVAIGISFYMFGLAKTTADSIISMRDKQVYLESAELDNGILYTSSEAVGSETAVGSGESIISGVTTQGDRIVDPEDVISTIYRYAAEKYAVTIIDGSNGKILARFDSSIESILQNKSIRLTNEVIEKLETQIKNNLYNTHQQPEDTNFLKRLYKIGSSEDRYGAPWLGNNEQIQKRVSTDIYGGTYEYNRQTYTGKNILTAIKNHTVIEVLNEIDESKHILDGTDDTGLIEEYEMPTVEVIYIIK